MEYENYFNRIPLGCQSLNREGRLINVNHAWLNIMGYRKEDVVGKYFSEFLAPGEIKTFLKKFMILKSNGEIHGAEMILLHKDGSMLEVAIEGKTIYDSNGVIVESLCFLSNITQQKRTENALRESSEKYRKLIYNINDIVWQTNADSEFVYISPQVKKLLGYRADDMKGKSVFDFISPDDLERNKSVFARAVINKPKNFTTDTKMLHRDGHVVTLESRASPLFDDENNFFGFIGVDRDVTEKRRAERALKEANKKLNLLSQITRHDINNQIMALNAYMDIISDNVSGEESKEYLKTCTNILKEIERQILFTREYHDIGTIEPVWQDVGGLIWELKPNFPIDISFHSEIGLVEIYADRMLEKVFFNLFSNSVNHGGQVSWISVSFSILNGCGTIIVEDDGIGIQSGMKNKVFERGIGTNSGFGLFLSSEILEITGISICENGIPGMGARFEITIPEGGWRAGSA